MRAMGLIFSALAADPGSGHAWEPAAADVRALSAGDLVLEVSPDPDGASGRIHAAVDIDAPRQTVWKTMLDCKLATRMVPGLQSCRVLEHDSQGRWDVREHVSRTWLFYPAVRTVFRSDYDPVQGFRFHGIAGDLKVLEGGWRLIPLGGTRTRVIYQSRAAAPFSVPGPLARLILRDQVGRALAALRREATAPPR